MAKLLKLRFLDLTDAEKPVYVTLFAEGKHLSYFKKEPKDLVDKSAEGTTCRTQKKLLTEVRVLGYPWRQVEPEQFKKHLRPLNIKRIRAGWEPIELPE